MTPHSPVTEAKLKDLRDAIENGDGWNFEEARPNLLRLLDMFEARDRAIEVLREAMKLNAVASYSGGVEWVRTRSTEALADAARILEGEP